MKYVTTATEKRVKNADCKYADILIYLLDEMKCRYACLGASIKEMKGYGINIDNATQMNVNETNDMRGLCYIYNDYIRYVGTNDLSYVNIDDFNGLVKAVIAGNGSHNPYKG